MFTKIINVYKNNKCVNVANISYIDVTYYSKITTYNVNRATRFGDTTFSAEWFIWHILLRNGQ